MNISLNYRYLSYYGYLLKREPEKEYGTERTTERTLSHVGTTQIVLAPSHTQREGQETDHVYHTRVRDDRERERQTVRAWQSMVQGWFHPVHSTIPSR